MARGNAPQTQVFYKGSSGEQFTVFVESEEMLKKWKGDSSIPMTDVVAGWKIMVPEYVDPLMLGRCTPLCVKLALAWRFPAFKRPRSGAGHMVGIC